MIEINKLEDFYVLKLADALFKRLYSIPICFLTHYNDEKNCSVKIKKGRLRKRCEIITILLTRIESIEDGRFIEAWINASGKDYDFATVQNAMLKVNKDVLAKYNQTLVKQIKNNLTN